MEIDVQDTNKLYITCSEQKECVYAFYIYYNDEIVARFPYTEKNYLSYWISESGKYKVQAYAKNMAGEKISKFSADVIFEADEAFGVYEQEEEKRSAFSQIVDISKDIFSNSKKIYRMAKFDYKLENKDTYLGKIWSILTPLLQIGTYWFVFGLGLRQRSEINGVSYLVWLIIGLVPWFFISGAILKGANSIYSKGNIVSKMKFEIVLLPISKVLQQFFEFIVMLFLMFLVIIISGERPSVYWLNVLYYGLYMCFFLVSLALVTSTLVMVARDFYKLLNSILRLIFYFTPILWVMDYMPEMFRRLTQYNPFYYIINGFRSSILYEKMFYSNLTTTIVMWVLAFTLYFFGCLLQSRFKNRFSDLM